MPYEGCLAAPVDKNTALVELVKSGTFPMSACMKVMKRDFLINNNLTFVKGQIAEDIPWFINVLDKCEKCSFINLYVYAYRQNVTTSITKSSGTKGFNCLLDILKTEVGKARTRSFDTSGHDALLSFLAYELCILLTYRQSIAEAKE